MTRPHFFLVCCTLVAACGDCGGEPAKKGQNNGDVGDTGMTVSDVGADAAVRDGGSDAGARDMNDGGVSDAAADVGGDVGVDMVMLPTAMGLYVSGAVGDDNNSGADDAPYATIGAAIAAGAQLVMGGAGPVNVIVAGAPAPNPLVYDEKVRVVEGVSVLGGHDCAALPCSWDRDPALYESVITNTDHEGVVVPAGVTRATFLNGLRIQGLGGRPTVAPGSAGISVEGSSPTIDGNWVTGGAITSGANFQSEQSHAIVVTGPTAVGAGPLIERNVVRGGSSTNVGSAIQLRNPGNNPPGVLAVIRRNDVRGPAARHSVGIRGFGAGTGLLIERNRINAGSSPGSGGAWGIEIGGAATIDANEINLDQQNRGACTSPNNWCGGIISESSLATITNNVISGVASPSSTAVLLGEFEIPAGRVVLNSNYLDGGGIAASSGGRSAAVVVSIGSCMTCGFNGRVGLIRNNILSGGLNLNRFGVYEEAPPGRSMMPDELEANQFFTAAGANYAHYRAFDGANAQLEPDINNLNAFAFAAGLLPNFDTDCGFDLTALTLPAGSTCVNAGTATDAPATDRDGDARPQGGAIDVGPDETQ